MDNLVEKQAEQRVSEVHAAGSKAHALALLDATRPQVLREMCNLSYIEHEGHGKVWMVRALAVEYGWLASLS